MPSKVYFSCRSSSLLVCFLVVVRALAVLAANDPPPEKPRLDRYGDALPPRAIARIGTLRFRNGNRISAVAFSPDGKRIASAGWDNTIRLWDVTTGQKRAAWPVPDGQSVLSVLFAPKGDLLASSSMQGFTYVWNAATGKLIRKLGEASDHQRRIAFSPKGTLLAVQAEEAKAVRIYETATGKQLLALEGHREPIRDIVFTPDGKQVLACGDDGTIRWWNLADGKELHCFQCDRPVNSTKKMP